MDEMMEDMLDAEDDEELEQEADAEVDKVLFELTDGKLGQAGTVGTGLPVCFFRLPRLTFTNFFMYSPHRSKWATKRRNVRWNSTVNS